MQGKMQVKELLANLVRIPSISGNEKKIGEFIFDYLSDVGLSPKIYKGNVYCPIGRGKKALLLTSHMDTVPVCPGWTKKPFKPEKARGRIYGLGANDAKGSLAAMIHAFTSLNEAELSGKVLFAATIQEETSNIGIGQVMGRIPKVDAAIVGEPTNLDICTAMRGLLILKLVARGKSAHASRPTQGVNAIYSACEDMQRLLKLKFNKAHGLLGLPSMSVTLISGGTKNNVIPGECEFTVDMRSTPMYGNAKLLSLVKKTVKSEVIALSSRLKPKGAQLSEKIVLAAKKANPGAKTRGFHAICDLALINAPGIILGPGKSEKSHAADEYIEVAQAEKASQIYRKTIANYFAT